MINIVEIKRVCSPYCEGNFGYRVEYTIHDLFGRHNMFAIFSSEREIGDGELLTALNENFNQQFKKIIYYD